MERGKRSEGVKKKKKYGTIRKIEDENRPCYAFANFKILFINIFEISKYTDILSTIS